MSNIIGLLICLALLLAVAFAVLNNNIIHPAKEGVPTDNSAKPLFKIILRWLAWISGVGTVFTFLGGPDGQFGSKESIIYGFVGLGWTALFTLIYRRIT